MKQAEQIFFKILMILSLATIAGVLLSLLWTIFSKGFPALSWEMISSPPEGGYYFGKSGGILNAIVGSVYLAVGATLLSAIFSVPIAFYLNLYLRRKPSWAAAIRFVADVLWGVPSIVYGAFGFTIMIYLGIHASLLAAIFTVTLFLIPVMVRTLDEYIRTIPSGLFEASLSLGSTLSETSYKVFFKQALGGFITAILLSFGRAIGDAAALLFTAGYTDMVPQHLNEPAATLPLSIFFQLSSPFPEVKERAYAAAAILTIIVLVISFGSRLSLRQFQKHTIK